jgi:hypothetical protein
MAANIAINLIDVVTLQPKWSYGELIDKPSVVAVVSIYGICYRFIWSSVSKIYP